jgi:hypothetical protein
VTHYTSKWEETKEEVRTHLQLGSNEGEDELDTITRLVFIERHKYADLCIALKTIQAVSRSALQRERGLAAKHASVLKWRKPRDKEKRLLKKSDEPGNLIG